MSPAAVVLVMPVATVALPRDSDVVPLSSTSSSDRDVASDAAYPVPSLPLHHARSCFRVYQRTSSHPQPSPPSPPPPTASDNEVSDLLRDVDIQLDLLQRRRRCHLVYHPHQLSISCDRGKWDGRVSSEAWQCVPTTCDHVDAADRHHHFDDDDNELTWSSGDATVHAPASVMNAFYRPSLDFNKMQVSCYIFAL